MLTIAPAFAGNSNTGKDYTNFGPDRMAPIFPKRGALAVYKNKTDTAPFHVAKEEHIDLDIDAWKSCLDAQSGDGWVRCSIGATTGWVKHSDFLSGGEYQPVGQWPIRYWIYIASSGMGSEETDMIIKAAKRSPYLIMPADYDNIFFKVKFDEQGNAISLKTGKKTGDRVFLVGSAVYLAPSDAKARDSAQWLFLNYYHPKLQAMCPAENPDSCFSAVNLANEWAGIRALNTEPAARYIYDEKRQRIEKKAWYGPQEVAFGRHSDPVVPLLYTVPDDVHMRIDPDELTDAQKRKNREKRVCIMDCSPTPAATRK
jgi:hypothetical protein